MLFHTFEFAVFLPLVFLLYWLVMNRNTALRNVFVVAASYVFYGWWDWRFLALLLTSTLVDYFLGIAMGNTNQPARRKGLLALSIGVNLGILGFFKYFNFFIENFASAWTFFGKHADLPSLHIILPVGISFYTFQTLSYTIDVYRSKLEPTRDFWAFAAYVSFFPQLVAGPIERATHLLPQFYKPTKFNYGFAAGGCRLMLWGFFKKIVIADHCAEYANMIFNQSDQYSGAMLWLGALFFAFQIYGDFSGYSDIAIGTARLFGIELMRNFAYPYFSRDIAEFWRRWHISLSTWFRDYVYVPLGGSRVTRPKLIRNTFIIFVVSGFWHGASWTFIAWGLLNALYFLPVQLLGKNRTHLDSVAAGKTVPSFRDFRMMTLTFLLTLVAWVFFRAGTIDHAFHYLASMFTGTVHAAGYHQVILLFMQHDVWMICILLLFFVLAEWVGREHVCPLFMLEQWRLRPARWIAYYVICLIIFTVGGKQQDFIYFQF